MSNKIGRNDPCHCGSKIKYKKCCLHKNKEIERLGMPFDKYVKEKMKEVRIKECLHPGNEKCSTKIVRAHSIQNNRVLREISEDGKLVRFGITTDTGKPKIVVEEIGRGCASIFNGFCEYHDGIFFQPIEIKSYSKGDLLQEFLYAYRAFTFEYIMKWEAYLLVSGAPVPKNDFHDTILSGYQRGLQDIERVKRVFDESIIKEDYTTIITKSIVIPKRVEIAVCTTFDLLYDLSGQSINDPLDFEKDTSLIFFNIFPAKNHTTVLMSVLKDDSDQYCSFFQQLSGLESDINRLTQVISNIVLYYCGNVYFRPSLWKTLDTDRQEKICSLYNSTTYDLSQENQDLTQKGFNFFEL